MSDSLRIRMYQAGFGDCFLIFLPTADGTKTMLVDCGSLGGGTPPFSRVVERLLADVGNHINVIVATHRHRDHISGFEHAGWKDVTADEVWMPWTERPDDAVALRIRSAQERLARSLLDVLPANADAGLRFLAENALTNEKARARLLQLGAGPQATPRSASSTSRGSTLPSPALPGVDVYVLGPLARRRPSPIWNRPEAQNFAESPGGGGWRAGRGRCWSVPESVAGLATQPALTPRDQPHPEHNSRYAA